MTGAKEAAGVGRLVFVALIPCFHQTLVIAIESGQGVLGLTPCTAHCTAWVLSQVGEFGGLEVHTPKLRTAYTHTTTKARTHVWHATSTPLHMPYLICSLIIRHPFSSEQKIRRWSCPTFLEKVGRSAVACMKPISHW